MQSDEEVGKVAQVVPIIICKLQFVVVCCETVQHQLILYLL